MDPDQTLFGERERGVGRGGLVFHACVSRLADWQTSKIKKKSVLTPLLQGSPSFVKVMMPWQYSSVINGLVLHYLDHILPTIAPYLTQYSMHHISLYFSIEDG